MNTKVKKVLSYVGVGFISAIFSVGALIGFSSCHSKAIKEEKSIQARSILPKRSGVLSTYLTAENLNQYRFLNLYDYIYGIDWSHYEGAPYPTTSLCLKYKQMSFYWTANYDHIVSFATLDEPTYYIYLQPSGIFTGYVESGFFDDSIDFTFPNYSGPASEAHTLGFRTQIENDLNERIYNVMGGFQFINDINYNAPYTASRLDVFVDDSSTDYPVIYKYFYQNWFRSGNQLFNSMRFQYMRYNPGDLYEIPGWDTPYHIDNEVDKYYFKELVYENTITGTRVVVNSRDFTTTPDGSVMLASSSWTSQSYRTIYLNIVDETLNAYLNRMNSNSYYPQPYTNVGTGEAMTSVFYLFSLAFGSWASIFAIEVVPGITIGLLMFLPLVAGIIVLIFWVVKR